MEVNRQELSEFLHNLLSENGEPENVYFQPPETVKLQYPCIMYRLGTLTSDYADNAPYRTTVMFEVTYITKSPTSEIPKALVKTPSFAFDRYYVADNLHHYVYNTTTTMKEVGNDGAYLGR